MFSSVPGKYEKVQKMQRSKKSYRKSWLWDRLLPFGLVSNMAKSRPSRYAELEVIRVQAHGNFLLFLFLFGVSFDEGAADGGARTVDIMIGADSADNAR